jgi:uncharacterized protein YndB with AHSA1/START domain
MAKQATELGPIVKSVTVNAPLQRAFELFTDGIATWWPLETHSVAEDRAETCVFEARQGGRIFERTATGEEHLWGAVVVWEPPHRVVYTWHPGRGEETAQEVEMHFSVERDGTRIDLEHRGWDRYGDGAAEMLRNYHGGWDYVLGRRYADAANR